MEEDDAEGGDDDSDSDGDDSDGDDSDGDDAEGNGKPSVRDASSAVDAANRDAARPASDAGAADAQSMRDARTSDASDEQTDAGSPMSESDAGGAASADAASDAAKGADDASVGDSGPFARAFHIALRVHRNKSALSGAAIASILEEVNEIWWKQASICFEVEVVSDDAVRRDGFDFWFHQRGLGCGADANGVYCGDHDIHSLDKPSLQRTDSPMWDTRQDAARTTAHELGHGLKLQHYNGYPDSNDSLMSSGRQGFKLHDAEIATARQRAEQKAIANAASTPCARVPVVDAP